ncbi:MAG: hypothetical protein SVU32_06165 [Candidatus Nanohaloarchaea archaeon]|nr:hypothetical protein [Candidatus Nanohaloarchaea archaeon]
MSDNPDVFNRYDIRGTYPDEIDEAFAERLGRAVATYADRHARSKVVVGRDTREHSEQVKDAFIDGLQQGGVAIHDAGVGTTDRVAVAAGHYGGIGVMVTASHHAWERTGFKLLYEQGHGFSNDDLETVKEYYRSRDFVAGTSRVVMDVAAEVDELYLERADRFLGEGGVTGLIVVDCCNGGAYRLAPTLLEEQGFDTERMHCSSTGGGVDPEPDEAGRQDVRERMEELDADLAIGFDPDGDRVYAFHPELGWIDGNELFYLLARLTEAERIAASVDTSELLEALDAEIEYTRVGDVFVSEQGVELDADLLGEPNGHYAVTEFSWYNSGMFCGALLARNHERLPDLLADAPRYETARRVHRVEEKQEVMQEVIKTVAQRYETLSTVDGIKFAGEGFTALARPSGTSQKIRLIVNGEADAVDVEDVADRLYDELFG